MEADGAAALGKAWLAKGPRSLCFAPGDMSEPGVGGTGAGFGVAAFGVATLAGVGGAAARGVAETEAGAGFGVRPLCGVAGIRRGVGAVSTGVTKSTETSSASCGVVSSFPGLAGVAVLCLAGVAATDCFPGVGATDCFAGVAET